MKKSVECAFCDGLATLLYEQKNIPFRKHEFKVFAAYYKCQNCNIEFTTTEADEFTLSQVYNLYREKLQIPSPDQLSNLRDKYNLSSKAFSELLGFGVNQFLNYEKGELPNESNGNLLYLCLDPQELEKLIDKKEELFSLNQLKRIKKIIEEETQRKRTFSLKNHLFNEFELPNKINGFTTPSYNKFANMCLYFLNNAAFKTRLNKMLFYADFTHFKYFGKSITGSSYAAINKGPVPEQYETKYSLLLDDCLSTELVTINSNETEKIIPLRKFDSTIFYDSELEVLKSILNYFEYKKTADIIEISHQEAAWIENQEQKQIISYSDYAPILKVL